MLSCLSVALLSPPLLFQAQLLITPLAASYGKKNDCNLRIPWIIASLVWTLVLAALYTLSFTFLSATIGWSDWANPFSFWHSLCCQRYSGSCSGKLTLKFPRLMNMLILPITSNTMVQIGDEKRWTDQREGVILSWYQPLVSFTRESAVPRMGKYWIDLHWVFQSWVKITQGYCEVWFQIWKLSKKIQYNSFC